MMPFEFQCLKHRGIEFSDWVLMKLDLYLGSRLYSAAVCSRIWSHYSGRRLVHHVNHSLCNIPCPAYWVAAAVESGEAP